MDDTDFDGRLERLTDDVPVRPLAATLRDARLDVLAAVASLRQVTDAALAGPWDWKGDSVEELRYGFYRIAEAFERAGIDAAERVRDARRVRGRSGDLIAPTTAARWDLHGLLVPLADDTWDAEPGGGEWSIRRTLGHVISSQRGYGLGTAWWQAKGFRSDDPALPKETDPSLWDGLPEEEDEADGTPADVRVRLDELIDRSTDRLAGMGEERLAAGARWSGFAVDVAFRLGRWGSHLREHAVQVEKTLVMLDRRPTEVDRLVRHVLASWGRAESAVYGGEAGARELEPLAGAAAEARSTAEELRAVAARQAGPQRTAFAGE